MCLRTLSGIRPIRFGIMQPLLIVPLALALLAGFGGLASADGQARIRSSSGLLPKISIINARLKTAGLSKYIKITRASQAGLDLQFDFEEEEPLIYNNPLEEKKALIRIFTILSDLSNLSMNRFSLKSGGRECTTVIQFRDDQVIF